MFYTLGSTVKSIKKSWKLTKEQILNGSWK